MPVFFIDEELGSVLSETLEIGFLEVPCTFSEAVLLKAELWTYQKLVAVTTMTPRDKATSTFFSKGTFCFISNIFLLNVILMLLNTKVRLKLPHFCHYCQTLAT